MSPLSLSFVTNFPHSDRVYIYIYISSLSPSVFFSFNHMPKEKQGDGAWPTALRPPIWSLTVTHSQQLTPRLVLVSSFYLSFLSLSLSLSVSLCFVRARASFFARLFCSIVQLVHECSNLRGRRTLVVAHMFQSESCFRTNASNPRSITLFRQWRAQMTSRRQCVSRRCRDATLRWHQYWLTSHRMRRCRRRCSC